MILTPSILREALLNSVQKKLDLRKVYPMRDAILNGEWDKELHRGKPVKIRRGQLINGHHRAFAIILADKPVDCYVEITE